MSKGGLSLVTLPNDFFGPGLGSSSFRKHRRVRSQDFMDLPLGGRDEDDPLSVYLGARDIMGFCRSIKIQVHKLKGSPCPLSLPFIAISMDCLLWNRPCPGEIFRRGNFRIQKIPWSCMTKVSPPLVIRNVKVGTPAVISRFVNFQAPWLGMCQKRRKDELQVARICEQTRVLSFKIRDRNRRWWEIQWLHFKVP